MIQVAIAAVALLVAIDISLIKRQVGPLIVLVLFVFSIIMGGNTDNIDYAIYENIYLQNDFTKDLGYGLLVRIGNLIGLSFEQFRLVIYIIGISILLISIKNICGVNKAGFFVLLYALYPSLFDTVQLRNFLAMCILTLALVVLSKRDFKSRMIYCLLIIAAGLIHKVAFIYFLFLIADMFEFTTEVKKFIVVSVIVSLACIGLNKGLSLKILQTVVASVGTDIDGINSYMTVNTHFGWIINWAQQFINCWILKQCNAAADSAKYSNLLTNRQKSYIKLIYKASLVCFVFLPLLSLDENYTRIIRNILPSIWITLCILPKFSMKGEMLTSNDGKLDLNVLTCKSISLIYAAILLLLLVGSYFDTIVVPIFTNNWILL